MISIEQKLKDATWDAVQEELCATHQCTVMIADFPFKCVTLSDGQRFIAAPDVHAFLAPTERRKASR